MGGGVPYNQLWIHRLMLRDLVRGEAFRTAIRHAVQPDSVVLDMGAGTGILSFFAAEAGAKKVYAIERTGIAELTKELAKRNHLLDKIEILQTDADTVNLPEQVDVIVSEWLGPIGVDENFLPALIRVRDRWLKPGGQILPHTATAWMAPVWDRQIEGDFIFWQTLPYGFDFSLIAHYTAEEIRHKQQHISSKDLLAPAQPLWTTDLRTCFLEQVWSTFRSELSFSFPTEGMMNGLALWFTAEFPDGTILSCGPDAPETHWGRTVCPLEKVFTYSEGTIIQTQFECEPDATPGNSRIRWTVLVDGKIWEAHDSRKALNKDR